MNGKRKGTGRMMYAEKKCEYIGEWYNDVYQGLGIIREQHIEYRGEFEKGRKVNHPTRAKLLTKPRMGNS